MNKITIVLLIFNLSLYSQEIRNRNIEFGGFGTLGGSNHNANLLDDDIENLNYCCPQFEDGSGFAWEVGLYFEYPLNKYLAISLRPSIRDISGILEFQEDLEEVNVNGVPQRGTSSHFLETSLLTGGFSLFLDFEPFYHLNISSGIRYAALLTADFDYYERITRPVNAIFKEEGRKTRNEQSDEFTNTQSLLSLEFSMSYSIPLDDLHKNLIIPEFYYSYGLTDILSNSEWKVNYWCLGIGYRFNLIGSQGENASPIAPD